MAPILVLPLLVGGWLLQQVAGTVNLRLRVMIDLGFIPLLGRDFNILYELSLINICLIEGFVLGISCRSFYKNLLTRSLSINFPLSYYFGKMDSKHFSFWWSSINSPTFI